MTLVPVPIITSKWCGLDCQVVPHFVTSQDWSTENPPQLWHSEGGVAYVADQKPDPTTWLRKPSWKGKLKALSYVKGQCSSSYLVQISINGSLPIIGFMSCQEFFKVISRIQNGEAYGTYGAGKKGSYYMITVIK